MTKTQNIFSNLRAAIGILAVFSILLGFIYPMFTTSVSQILFNDKVNGSLVEKNGKIIGSRLLGQEFSEDKYLWGRLSANGYDAQKSGGTNYSIANHKQLESANARIGALQKSDPTNQEKIPVELITASGSGLDPNISLAAALYQAPRIAKARGISTEEVEKLVNQNIEPQSQVFGYPYVNVLFANLALDAVQNQDNKK